MAGPFDRPINLGDLYNSAFGDGVKGGSLNFTRDSEGNLVNAHFSIYGDGAHFSWDVDPKTGDVSGVHGWIHDPRTPW